MNKATLGAGCFWCVEAIFQRLEGVSKVLPGYTGGQTVNPSYQEVCQGNTGHAEVAQITYDPDLISYRELLEVFWKTHDPTTLNRQGNDVGTQYRSAIFYHDQQQKELALDMKEKLDQSHLWSSPIVTEIAPLSEFYSAEDYHINYFNQHKDQPYCQFVIRPKLDKFYKEFENKLSK